MKKVFFITAAVSVLFCGCQDGDIRENGSDEKGRVLSIAEVGLAFPSENRTAKLDFSTGDEIGLHVYAYPAQNWESQKLTYLSPKWALDTPIPLSTDGVSVYASYPYQPGYSHPSLFFLEHVSQIDFLYSQICHVNSSYPSLYLKMMHALALIEFEFEFGFDASPYSAIGMIDFISIEGKGLHSKAVFDLLSGKFEYVEGANKPALVYGSDLDTPMVYSGRRVGVMVVPVKKVATEGDILLNIRLNTSQVCFPVPAGTKWESGKKYTYKVMVKERILEITHVRVQDWIDQGTQKIQLPIENKQN